MTRRAWGLTARLLWLGLLPGLLAMLLLGWVLHGSIRDSLYGGLAQRLGERADRIQANLSITPDGQWQHDPGRSSDAFGQIFSGWYWLLQSQHPTPEPLLYSRSLWDGSLPAPTPSGHATLQASTDPRGRALLGLQRRIAIDNHQATLTVYAPAEEATADLARIRRVLWLALAALLLIATATTLVQVRVGLRPLALLRQRLARLHGQNTDTPPDSAPATLGNGYGPDLDPLAREIDALLERNARMLARGRAHAADLSHALKTPLARLSAEASRQPHTPSTLVLAQVDSIDGLIERHLSRTTTSGNQAAALAQTVPVREVVEQLVQLMQHVHRNKPLHWHTEASAELHWRGDRSDLEEMLGNLLDNAAKWAASHVAITIGIAIGNPGPPALLQLRIADDGPGISADHLQHAARRGQRFDQSTPGSGLGLAIVADIAHTWGGQLALSRSPTLGGLQATLSLPGALARTDAH